ncbi:MAG: hypothetical protein M3Z01_09390 [Thermoproteota archaeon]|nr:hypothetical protein [Thermoproteota archaeon]
MNKKIDENYKTRQKILTRVKDYLNIDFNKIAIYLTDINIKYPNDNNHILKKENNKDHILFKVEIPASIITHARFYYKGIDIDVLTIEEAKNLEKDLEYILTEIEKKIDECTNK